MCDMPEFFFSFLKKKSFLEKRGKCMFPIKHKNFKQILQFVTLIFLENIVCLKVYIQ